MRFDGLVITTVACLALAVGSACAAEMTVQNTSQLQAALGMATGGDVILLTGGDYGGVRLKDYQFDSHVTLRAADRTDPPVFSAFRIDNGRNMVIDGLTLFRGQTIPESEYYALVELYPSEAITFVHCRFHGATIESGAGAGYASGFGIHVRGCTNTTLRRCVFTNVRKAVVTYGTSGMGLTLEQNYVYHHREDAFYVFGGDNLIADNIVLDNNPRILPDGAGDHADMIQANIHHSVVRNNFFRGSAQGMHSSGYHTDWGDPSLAGNNTIENNIIYTTWARGIGVWDMPDSTVAHNTALAPWDPSPARVHLQLTEGSLGSGGSDVAYNLAEKVNEDTPGVTYTGNVNVQRDDPEGADPYLEDVLVGGLVTGESPIADFAVKDGAFPGSAETPGADPGQFFWLTVGDPSDPDNQMYPLWLQLDEEGRDKLREALDLAPALRGDADGDGDVDLDDFAILKTNFAR